MKHEVDFSKRINLAFDVIASFSDIGLKMIFLLSMISFILIVLIELYVLVVKLSLNSVVTGWTTPMLFMSMSFIGSHAIYPN